MAHLRTSRLSISAISAVFLQNFVSFLFFALVFCTSSFLLLFPALFPPSRASSPFFLPRAPSGFGFSSHPARNSLSAIHASTFPRSLAVFLSTSRAHGTRGDLARNACSFRALGFRQLVALISRATISAQGGSRYTLHREVPLTALSFLL